MPSFAGFRLQALVYLGLSSFIKCAVRPDQSVRVFFNASTVHLIKSRGLVQVTLVHNQDQ